MRLEVKTTLATRAMAHACTVKVDLRGVNVKSAQVNLLLDLVLTNAHNALKATMGQAVIKVTMCCTYIHRVLTLV